MIEGSPVDQSVAQKVYDFAKGKNQILVVLDSNHTHKHVLRELNLYSILVTRGSYIVVFDTIIEDLPEDSFPDRPWCKGNDPKTAVLEFLKTSDRFEIDKSFQNKLIITAAPDGYLKCIK
jgi:cephalosporin hydroxylase